MGLKRVRILFFFSLMLLCGVSGHSGLAQAVEPSQEYQDIYAKAMQAFLEEQYEDTLSLLEQAIALEPQQANAYNLAGAANVKLRNYNQAATSFQQILALDPENMIAIFNLGESYFLLKDYTKSKQYFQTFLNIEGNSANALARFKLLLCHLLGGNEESARATVEALRPTISHPLAYYGNAALHFHAGNNDEARSYLKSAFEIYPGGVNLAFADSLVELGWLERNEVAQIGAVNAAALQSLSREFQPDIEQDDSNALFKRFDSLLPSIGGDDKNSENP